MLNEDMRPLDLQHHLNILGLKGEQVRNRSVANANINGSTSLVLDENSNEIVSSAKMVDFGSIMSCLQQEVDSTGTLTPIKIQKFKLILDDTDKVYMANMCAFWSPKTTFVNCGVFSII